MVVKSTGEIVKTVISSPELFALQAGESELVFALLDDDGGVIDDDGVQISEDGVFEAKPGKTPAHIPLFDLGLVAG